MSDQPSDPSDGDPFPIDLSVARMARVENFLADGDAHFAVDRAAAESIGELSPGGLEGLRGLVQTVKTFVTRAVRYLTGEVGVRQYLHIGMSTPTTGMVHDVAWEIAPEARVVYASYDPTTLAHVHRLGKDATEGVVAHVHSDFDDPQAILREAAATLDFRQPVALVLPTTLNLIPDDGVAHQIVDDLRAAVTPGSYLIIAHTSLDIAPEAIAKAIERFNEILAERYVVRSKDQITALLDGFDLVDPGLVPLENWHPDDDRPAPKGRRPVPVYGAVGRKPDTR
ncbi:MAG: SAM-dependent methyltransferase [Acidimicrobiales bacterium]